MPPLTTRQKNAVNRLMEITGASESVAKTLLKRHNYEVEPASNAYFDQQSRPHTAAPSSASSMAVENVKAKLQALFDKYRDVNDAPDETGFDGTMKYLQELNISLEDSSHLIALELVQSPSMGVMKKQAFVDGWVKASAASRKSLDTIPKQQAYLASLKPLLSSDKDFFKRVYRHTFACSKEAGQKAMTLDVALTYWGLLFRSPGMEWKTANTNWLDLWLDYLQKNWTKTVSKDMWNQTAEFALKSLADDALSFWSDEGAWPSVIDDFVAWAKESRSGREGDKMETD